MEALCQEMAGDSLLYSMIRVWSSPVDCPLQGPHSLSYGKGGATRQCSHPPSLMDSCTDHSVLQVSHARITESIYLNPILPLSEM